jgi:hypothetical protein
VVKKREVPCPNKECFYNLKGKCYHGMVDSKKALEASKCGKWEHFKPKKDKTSG